ncbi:MAG: transcriptional regulator [Caulobacter sp.]|nr:transcriptional regulator [Caulobacter sp.]
MSWLNQPKIYSHEIHTHSLVEDAALAATLDRYPAELLDINAYSYDAEGQVSLETGERGRADGATLLEAIKAGQVWVNLRDAHEAHPELWRHIQPVFDEIADDLGVKPIKVTGQLILSSPQTKVPYHFDAAGVVLFHLRGTKRLWVYPTDEAHLPQESMEKVIMRVQAEELPYRLAFDGDAQVVDLQPGQALTWPLYAPHRVENQGVFNVSLSLDFQTWETRLTRGAHYANGVLRRWGLAPGAMDKTPMAARAGLWAASLAMKKANLAPNLIKDYQRSFALSDQVKPAA